MVCAGRVEGHCRLRGRLRSSSLPAPLPDPSPSGSSQPLRLDSSPSLAPAPQAHPSPSLSPQPLGVTSAPQAHPSPSGSPQLTPLLPSPSVVSGHPQWGHWQHLPEPRLTGDVFPPLEPDTPDPDALHRPCQIPPVHTTGEGDSPPGGLRQKDHPPQCPRR